MRPARRRPLLLRAQHDVAVGRVRRHRVGRHLRGANAGEHALDLGELLQECGFELLLHRHRLRQAGSRNAQGQDCQVTLVQVGRELGAQAGGEQA